MHTRSFAGSFQEIAKVLSGTRIPKQLFLLDGFTIILKFPLSVIGGATQKLQELFHADFLSSREDSGSSDDHNSAPINRWIPTGFSGCVMSTIWACLFT